MFVRRTPVTSKERRYEYMHLVESYRRESDGRPTHRVLANLGRFDQRTFDNLNLALQASKDGCQVVVTSRADATRPPQKPAANLRYLDLAVFLELWREWTLDEVLREIMPPGEALVGCSGVIAALTLQRCVEPTSKLAATRWFPHTALPELLGIAPGQFNNTRVHRVLEELERSTVTLMSWLPRLYQERGPVFATLFLDVTDTWFVGHGPPAAQRAKTKEGLTAPKIGIVLLCNERGFPLRWEVVPGRSADCDAMTGLLQGVAGLPWLRNVPVVMDRAMGKTALVARLVGLSIRFLTAITTPEFSSYAPDLPWRTVTALQPRAEDDPEVVDEAARLVEAAGMQRVESNLFVVDYGVVTREQEEVHASGDADGAEPTIEAMRLCRTFNQQVADGRYSSYAAAGRALGLEKGVVRKYCSLGRLSETLQHRILSGEASGRSLAELLKIAGLDRTEAQQAAFDALLAKPGRTHAPALAPTSPASGPVSTDEEKASKAMQVRVVAYFNPERFVEQRGSAKKKINDIQTFVAKLNDQLSSPRSKKRPDSILATVNAKLRAAELLDAFDVEVTRQTPLDGGERFQVEVALDQAKWEARRRYDGFSVLLGHSEIGQSGPELCQLYRDKDAVEKDFQIVKSVLELRPVRHHTDDKVRAHVTLCMLALLLERTLKEKLTGTYTTGMALEHLERARLNRYSNNRGPDLYTITELDDDQRAILRTLRMKHIGDDHYLTERISPR